MLTLHQREFIKVLAECETVREACEKLQWPAPRGYAVVEAVRGKRGKYRDDENWIIAKERQNVRLRRLLLPMRKSKSQAQSTVSAEPAGTIDLGQSNP